MFIYVVDDLELERFLCSEVNFNCYGTKEIYFNKTNEQFTICISKHKKCFLNSIDLEFPSEFSHNFSVQVNSEVSYYKKNNVFIHLTINNTMVPCTMNLKGKIFVILKWSWKNS